MVGTGYSNMQKAIELIRVSTEGQASEDRASIPAQRAINRRTAQMYGLEIVRTIEMSNVSGAAVLKAPEMRELLRAIENPEIHGVVVREFSRVMRPDNFADYVLLQAFQDTGTVLYLPDGPMDFRSKTGRLMGTIRAAIAGLERAEILERVWTAKEEKRRAGKLAQSHVCLPFGVGYTEGQGFFYKPEAARVREAFRLFSSGEQSYQKLASIVGVTPRGMHLIMRNPIWTGWRVIDRKRDASTSGRRVKENGRQADRPKIRREPDEVIRVKVIHDPLISEADFQRIQGMMDIKQSRHWRARHDYVHRFTYNGFLICSECQEIIYTGLMRDDYYICKGKRLARKCSTRYMRRDRLEGVLDDLFASRLTDSGFLREVIEGILLMNRANDDENRVAKLSNILAKLEAKRRRVLDAYVEGVMAKGERDSRLAGIEREIESTRSLLQLHPPAAISAEDLALMLSPLFEWKFLGREEKRRILSVMVPEIFVADYRVTGVSLSMPPAQRRHDEIHTDRDSSLPPA